MEEQLLIKCAPFFVFGYGYIWVQRADIQNILHTFAPDLKTFRKNNL